MWWEIPVPRRDCLALHVNRGAKLTEKRVSTPLPATQSPYLLTLLGKKMYYFNMASSPSPSRFNPNLGVLFPRLAEEVFFFSLQSKKTDCAPFHWVFIEASPEDSNDVLHVYSVSSTPPPRVKCHLQTHRRSFLLMIFKKCM